MRDGAAKRPTIGFLSTWAIYEGTSLDWYAHTFLRGVCAATHDRGCDLLLGCGIGLPAGPRESRTGWAAPATGVDFIPVGPWNADGLIIIPDDLSDAQCAYVEDLIRSGYPVIATTAEKPWPLVAVDNASGIRQALAHLLQHGHQQIAFIAGNSGRGGDSAERSSAYREGLRDAGLAEDPRLIAFGELCYSGGRAAMERILASGAPFTALLASNDQSCLGAIAALHEAGRRIAEDVAVIGFDDTLDARSHVPPLTTVRHPTFALGYQAVLALLDTLAGTQASAVHERIPTRLVVRQSCGCGPKSIQSLCIANASRLDRSAVASALARAMAEATLVETRYSSFEELETECLALVRAFARSLDRGDSADFAAALQGLLRWIELRDEDAAAWQAALSVFRRNLAVLLPDIPPARLAEAEMVLDDARVAMSEYAQRQATRALLHHQQMTSRLGLMTAQLLSALDVSESANILAQHIAQLRIDHIVVATYVPQDDDLFAQSAVLISAGTPARQIGRRFPTRRFPPPGLYPPGAAVRLVVLPLVIDDQATGFVALSATNLEPCAAIAHHLAAALRTSRLYLDALEGRRQAEEASRLKSRFLSMVSHELRTPLSLIVGLSEMALREHGDALRRSGAALGDIEQIHISAQHLGRLIGDVLDLASSEAGQLHLVREPLDLAEVLRGVAALGEQMARDKGLAWQMRLPQGIQISGDRTRLRQVVLNLIGNAVKFTASGTVAVDLAASQGQAVVSVSDTGIGVPPAEQELIFREFHRAEQAHRSGYSGLGLGLAVCKQLVTQHRGTLGVRSPGDLGGATFFFTLPLLLDRDQGELPENNYPHKPIGLEQFAVDLGRYSKAEGPRGGRQVVLVIDDNPGILDLYCRLLERMGYSAPRARNGREALGILDQLRPNLILLDLMMPEMDGFAMLDALRANQATRAIPVIVLTARSVTEADIERCNRGVAALFNKGLFNAVEILDRVEAVLAHHQTLHGPIQRLVRRAMAFIHAHYAEPLRREQIARHVGVSADYLADCFRQELGVTPTTYLHRYRIYQARELLANSDLTIAAVAHAVGFSEGAHFTRTFHREVGVSPRAYRRGQALDKMTR
jgi:signal transduction histidine kinase/AraC-like DNA-binding protein/ABC-type sugar transport system substrate-binding protein